MSEQETRLRGLLEYLGGDGQGAALRRDASIALGLLDALLESHRQEVAEWKTKALDVESHPVVVAMRQEHDELRQEVERLKARLTAAETERNDFARQATEAERERDEARERLKTEITRANMAEVDRDEARAALADHSGTVTRIAMALGCVSALQDVETGVTALLGDRDAWKAANGLSVQRWQKAEADNAALLDSLTTMTKGAYTLGDLAMARARVANDHPGAALLREGAALRKVRVACEPWRVAVAAVFEVHHAPPKFALDVSLTAQDGDALLSACADADKARGGQ